jgi:hypothetical protein
MPKAELEGYEKGARVRVLSNSSRPERLHEGQVDDGNKLELADVKVHGDAGEKTGRVAWTYASDLDGSPWAWVKIDGTRGHLMDQLAYRLEDLELVDLEVEEGLEAVVASA